MQYAIQLNSDANSLESVAAIKKVLEEAEKNFPPDMKIEIVQDNTEYVKESLKEVGVTFIETLLLVVLITWIFLQSWRATLIPVLAIPVSLLGTFTSFYIFGFTINTLTLFALVLAIGIASMTPSLLSKPLNITSMNGHESKGSYFRRYAQRIGRYCGNGFRAPCRVPASFLYGRGNGRSV